MGYPDILTGYPVKIMRTSCRISCRISYRISYRISHLLPANSDWAPAAAPWLCILPTGPVSAADSALLCLCSESRRGLQHTVFLFPVPGARSARSSPEPATRGPRGPETPSGRMAQDVPVNGGGGRGLGKWVGEGGRGRRKGRGEGKGEGGRGRRRRRRTSSQ